jgi:hypothetical protein
MGYYILMGSLAQMKSTGAALLLLEAATLIRSRGWSRLVYRDPASGALDAVGALCVAAGAKPHLVVDRDDIISFCVPESKQAAVLVAIEVLSHVLKDDLVAWQCVRANCEAELLNGMKVAASLLKNAIDD